MSDEQKIGSTGSSGKGSKSSSLGGSVGKGSKKAVSIVSVGKGIKATVSRLSRSAGKAPKKTGSTRSAGKSEKKSDSTELAGNNKDDIAVSSAPDDYNEADVSAAASSGYTGNRHLTRFRQIEKLQKLHGVDARRLAGTSSQPLPTTNGAATRSDADGKDEDIGKAPSAEE
jgi:hypothetical protein